MVGVKKKIAEYGYVILFLSGLSLWLITRLLESYYGAYRILSWLPLIISQFFLIICLIIIVRLRRQVYTDHLTGLNNRKYFDDKLADFKAIDTTALILLDVDDFKSINDTYGHLAGDQVLRQFAAILRSNTRKKDRLARWGGDEFAIILPATDAKEAYKIADRVRRMVEGYPFCYEGTTFNITVSLGLASTREGAGLNMEQFLRMADVALYQAKEKKNTVCALFNNELLA